MKKMADKKRTELSFEKGDWVLVKLQPCRQHSLVLRKHQKLSMRYFGPFKVLQKIGFVAYKLELSLEARLHPVPIHSLEQFCTKANKLYRYWCNGRVCHPTTILGKILIN